MNSLTVNYKSLLLFSNFLLALENHKLNNELCEAEYESLSREPLNSITQRFAVT